MLRNLVLCGSVVIWIATSRLLPGDEPAASPEAPPSQESSTPVAKPAEKTAEIETWISQLDSDSYVEREAATRSLIKVGKPAIDLLVEAGRGNNLEVTSRVVRILRELYRSGDDVSVDAAELALEELLASERASVTQRAQSAFVANAKLRQQRALVEIQKLGGKIKFLPGNRFIEEDDKAPQAANNQNNISHIILNQHWKGEDRGLTYVKRLSNLRTLFVTTLAPVSEVGLNDLAKALPELRIERRGDACLGVSSMATQLGCQILTVEKESSADIAGLKEGDIILTFDELPVKDFEQMKTMIAKHKVGDKVIIQLSRNDQMLTKEVILGEWK